MALPHGGGVNLLNDIVRQPNRYAPFMDRLRALFSDMDREYGRVAARHGFYCQGCEENCCLTRFHHHTLAEYLYLWNGFRELPEPERQSVRRRAENVIRQTAELENKGEPVRIMCPVNVDGWCRLYPRRPMICRLHGLAHELRRPGGGAVRGPGCDLFTRTAGDKPYIPFDRTPFYTEMARLEQSLRASLPASERVRMTVAEMIVRFPAGAASYRS